MPAFQESRVVAARNAAAQDPRLQLVVEVITTTLHNGLMKVLEPTGAEWLAALLFLTRAGKMCSAVRQADAVHGRILDTSGNPISGGGA